MVDFTMLILLPLLILILRNFPSGMLQKFVLLGAGNVKEAFYNLFTDDPVNWMKWAVVFIILILGYVIAIPLYKKASYRLSWERKRDLISVLS